MDVSSKLNHMFHRHKAVVLIVATAFSGFAGWIGNASFGQPSVESVQKYVEANPSAIKKPEDWLADPNEPAIYKLKFAKGSLVCVPDPYIGYEMGLLLEIEYLTYLLNTGYLSDHKKDLKERSNRLHELRAFCVDNDPLSDAEKQEIYNKDHDFRLKMYKSSLELRALERRAEQK